MNAGTDPQLDVQQDVPEQLRALEGTYVGAWTEFGIDGGAVVERASWTDTMTAGGSRLTEDRAYVVTSDEMTFTGSQAPPFTVEGKEGYHLTETGELGDYFIEIYGQHQCLTRLDDDVWTYSAPAAEQELAHLGFPGGASGMHVVVKVVTAERGAETHRISRVTTVRWTADDGEEQALQFVSLQGHHRRRPG